MTEPTHRDQLPAATTARPSAGSSTQSTYRQLVSRGLNANEAANLTAFIKGLAVGRQPWKIDELTHVLFLRELDRLGTFGANDGSER
jgi:hypothetical protein